VRIVNTRPKRPAPARKPAAGAWSTGGVEVANPMSIYPETENPFNIERYLGHLVAVQYVLRASGAW
jgi:hypothetical protein